MGNGLPQQLANIQGVFLCPALMRAAPWLWACCVASMLGTTLLTCGVGLNLYTL